MGGKQAEVVLEYLHTLKEADSVSPIALTDEERTSICGTYRFGVGPSQVVEVNDDMVLTSITLCTLTLRNSIGCGATL